MKTRMSMVSLLLVVGLYTTSAAELSFQFSTNNAPLFDFSGAWETNDQGVYEAFSMELSPRGRISGTYTASGDEDGIHIEMDGPLSGSIAVRYPIDFRMALKLRGDFVASQGSMEVHGRFNLHGVFVLSEESGVGQGRLNGTICARGRCMNVHRTMEIPLTDGSSSSADGEGRWTLSLAVEQAGRRTTGTATVTLANERAATFTVHGATSSKGVTKLQLRGTGEATGAVLKVQLNAAQEITALQGRLYGQRLAWNATL